MIQIKAHGQEQERKSFWTGLSLILMLRSGSGGSDKEGDARGGLPPRGGAVDGALTIIPLRSAEENERASVYNFSRLCAKTSSR